jgi:hypothetical protein
VANYKKHYYTKIFHSITQFPYFYMTFSTQVLKNERYLFPEPKARKLFFIKLPFLSAMASRRGVPDDPSEYFFTIFFDVAASADGRRESESRRKIPQHVLSASRELQRTGGDTIKIFTLLKRCFTTPNAPALVV